MAAAGLAFACALAAPCMAQEIPARGPAYLTFGAGGFNVIDPDGESRSDLRIEYRHGEHFLGLKPWVGVEITRDSAFWGGAGILLDTVWWGHFVVTLSTGAGGYTEGNAKDLGGSLEFRSQIELGYRFTGHSRVTAAFGHISNAGLGDHNPGGETVTLYYHLPLSRPHRGEAEG
jgi:hypothetical protein